MIIEAGITRNPDGTTLARARSRSTAVPQATIKRTHGLFIKVARLHMLKNKTLAVAAALSAGVIVVGSGAGCESKAGTGALIGAGAGAGIGAIIGHNSH